LKRDYEVPDGRVAEEESSGQASHSDDLNYRVRCEYCGNDLRRLARQGFMQTKIYSRFGYYPWECPLCREPMLVKQQHRLKKRDAAEPSGAGPVAAGQVPEGLVPNGPVRVGVSAMQAKSLEPAAIGRNVAEPATMQPDLLEPFVLEPGIARSRGKRPGTAGSRANR